MCGIAGIAAPEPVDQREWLITGRDTLCHRGPDDLGVWWSADGRVGLAHRRLAVIDLSPGGHQPMENAAGTLAITFNGEIYNYRELKRELEALGHAFRTASDTEVVLAAYRQWGDECFGRLNGMFALALFDRVAERVLLARDRAGEKPLFYHQLGGQLAFASELKALLADPRVPRALDLDAFDWYLAYGYVPGSRCILRGVRKLPPAHALAYDLRRGETRVWRYWGLPAPFGGAVPSLDALADELEPLLADAVRLQLAADVPVGVLLSGGVDSSLVTAMAVRASGHAVRTFTITFPGHEGIDEGPYARLVADHFGTRHTELVAEPATVDLLPTLARQYDEPIADQSMVPTYLVSRLIRQSATVALGGDGGDELFGGYTSYSWMLRQQRVRRSLPRVARRLLAAAARPLPVGFRGRTYMLALGYDQRISAAHANLYFDSEMRRRLAPPLRTRPGLGPERARADLGLGDTVVEQMTSADFLTYLPDDILVKVDRASMLTSLEVRAPLLDYRVAEFAFSRVPPQYRATELERKILLRHLAKRLLPPALDLRRKQGFVLPLARWFAGPWGRFMESVLMEADPVLFDRGTVARLIEGQRRGLANSQRLFALAIFELWRREYGVALPD